MSSLGVGLARAARTTVLASVIVAFAAASHVLAGGHQPGIWALLPASAIALGVAHVMTFTRTNLIATFGVLGVAQLGFHSLAEWCPPWCTDPMDHMAEHSSGPTMSAAHLVAALLTALVVSHGDTVLWRLWHWLSRTLRIPAFGVLVAEQRCRPAFFTHFVPASEPATGAASRRGPPLLPAFV